MSQPRSNCPQCGAPVQFRFSSGVQTVCEFCKSVLVRTGVDLEKVGVQADLPLDVSPIWINTEGIYHGKAFTVAGRIVYEWDQGGWNEWHLVFQDGTSGWLSDAQADYNVSFVYTKARSIPEASGIQRGASFQWDRTAFEVTTITRARYVGVQGELPFQYWDKEEVLFADLRSRDTRFATIDYSDDPPLLFLGEPVEFSDLKFKNLRSFEGWS